MTHVSIIIRTRNEERWIAQCIRKVTEQTLDDTEIILVDNLSTDKTVEKARYVEPDLTVVEIDDYMPGLALNEGIRISEGEFIVCLSAHCIPVDEYWLENLRGNFDEEGDVAGVYGRQVPVEFSDPVDKRDLIRTFGLERRVQERDTFFHNANSMIRRDVWEEHPFKEEVTNIEDQIWGNEVINAGYKLVYEPDAAVYHHHGINQGNDRNRMKSVVRTMENYEIQPENKLGSDLEGNPLDPENLDIVSIVPVRRHINTGVDSDETLIAQTIDAALESTYINDVIVSTDSEQVAEKATDWGARAPFIRPEELSVKEVQTNEVFKFSLEQVEDQGRYPDVVVPLEITHPFRPSGMIDEMIEELLRTDFETIVASYPEYRPCWMSDGDDGFDRVNENTKFRQDRSPVQVGLVGLGCVTYPRQIRQGRRLGDNTGVHEISNPIATLEIRHRDDLQHWEKLREVHNLMS